MENELITQLRKSFKDAGEYPDAIQQSCYTLNKAPKLKQFLESLFGKGSVIAAYDRESCFDEGEWDMGCCDSVFVTKTGKVVEVSNSEWGYMIVAGTFKGENDE